MFDQKLYRLLQRTWRQPNKDWTSKVLDEMFWPLADSEPITYKASTRMKEFGEGEKKTKKRELNIEVEVGTRRWIEGRGTYQPRLTRLFLERFCGLDADMEHGTEIDWTGKFFEFAEWVKQWRGDFYIYPRGNDTINEDKIVINGLITKPFRIFSTPDVPLMREQSYFGDDDEFVFLSAVYGSGYWQRAWMPVIFTHDDNDLSDWGKAELNCPKCGAWWTYYIGMTDADSDRVNLMPYGAKKPEDLPDVREMHPWERYLEEVTSVARFLPAGPQLISVPRLPHRAAIQKPNNGQLAPDTGQQTIWVDGDKIICPVCRRAHLVANLPIIS